MTGTLDRLTDELIQQIHSSRTESTWSDDRFFSWADRIAHAQARLNPRIHTAPPRDWSSLEQLPALTTDSFRYTRVASFPDRIGPSVRFLTSGTTSSCRGVHALYRTDIYDASALTAFELLVLARSRPVHLISLVPSRSMAPDSSLSYMVDLFARTHFGKSTTVGVDRGGIQVGLVESALREAVKSGQPVLLFTTTLAAQALLETGLKMEMPPSSLILTTGGAKGSDGFIDPAGVDMALGEHLGRAILGSEYGMTELLSQAYRFGQEPFVLPPWCRVAVMDPSTGKRQPANAPGLLRFIDLANIQSAMTVQTADLGLACSENSFHLLGRASGSEPRGCSITYRELAGPHDESK